VKYEKILKYRDITMALIKKFDSYTIDNVPQKDNHHIDAMASVASLISLLDPSKDYIFIL
jgi:hypothetical protein